MLKGLGFLLLVGAVVGALFWLKICDVRTARMNVKGYGGAAIGTVSQLASTGAPAKASDRSNASSKACRDNLNRIQTAKRSIASKTGITIGAVSQDALMRELGGKMPRCPAGGTYQIGTHEVLSRCSVGGNGTMDGGDDHLIGQ